jgi:L-ribulose-5-phosphate 3-epimerase
MWKGDKAEMIKCNDWAVGVCTWSLRNDLAKIAKLKKRTGLAHLHLAISPALGANGDEFLAGVEEGGYEITATMIDYRQEDYSTLEAIRRTGGIVPDDCWQANKCRTLDAIELTSRLQVAYLTTHVGFIDHTNADEYDKLADRAKLLADAAAEKQVMLLMETGQETAADLRRFLEELEHPALGVNFDPANMILYGKGDPLEAVQTLAPWIRHVHIKDALRTQVPGTWGTEVAWGTGQVGAESFLSGLKQAGFEGALAIEREAGDDRMGDVVKATETLKRFNG